MCMCVVCMCRVEEEAFEAAQLLIVLRLWRILRVINGNMNLFTEITPAE